MDKGKILECLAQVLETDAAELARLEETASLQEVGMTSISFIQFVVAVEDAFSLEVRDSDLLMEKFQTLGDVYQTLSAYLDSPGPMKKCLALDCDNVLWRGISGEEPIRLDSRALALQRTLLELVDRGVLLCLCSRNEDAFVRASFAHPDMLLREEHIAAARVNRGNKADNLLAMAAELHLTADSFVFLDDSDYELGLVRSLLPEVVCVKAEQASIQWLAELSALFPAESAGERNRTVLYREQKEREKTKRLYDTVEEYNRSLQTVCRCAPATEQELPRLAELSQRTHQCNLADTHYTREELAALREDPRYILLALSAADVYGDMGLVGLAVVRDDVIEGFMLSCRVFDRDFEQALLSAVREKAGPSLRGVYRATAKNTRYRDFYERNGVEPL